MYKCRGRHEAGSDNRTCKLYCVFNQVGWRKLLERVMGIEPTSSAWKAEVLPLNYTRQTHCRCILTSYRPPPGQGRAEPDIWWRGGIDSRPGPGQPLDRSPVSPSPALRAMRGVRNRSRRFHEPPSVQTLPLQQQENNPDIWWRGEDLNLRRLSRQIYSLIPLTTREPLQNASPLLCCRRC